MKIVSTICIVLLCSINYMLFAQNARFISSGSIVFEKSVNIYGLIKLHMGKDTSPTTLTGIDQYKQSHPQFRKYSSTLTFNNNKTLYTPESVPLESVYGNRDPLATAGNVVYTDFSTSAVIAQKTVYEDVFLLKDSTRKINWRFTDETREIAGFTCRRANALIGDTYVVAFFTDKIHVSGGPELFGGLPGMILGVALPHDNVTWFATKVTDSTVSPASVAPPKKGKQLNNAQLLNFLKEKTKTWGSDGRYETRIYML